MNDTDPVLVGVAQLVQRDVDPAEAPEPLAMLEQMARTAAEDAGAGDRLLADLDTVAVLSVAGWSPQNPPRLLAERIGAHPANEYVTEVGGQIGVTAASFVAARIASGESRVALVAGCNNMRTLAKARRAGVTLDWAQGGGGEPAMIGAMKPGSNEREAAYGLASPPDIYPVFENALRARRGMSLDEHRASMGRLFSRFTEVAAENPYAWFPRRRTPEELTTASPENRMIAFPYTKYLNAILQTDQAAALILTSAGAARALGIPQDRWVYWWGGAMAEEQAWWPSERPDFASCPAMFDSTAGALSAAGVAMDEIGHIDFYSCFPIAVEMACRMLGIQEDDPRGFTVTGGLPYGGGPASAYTLHSLASMAERLRGDPGAKGLVTGNGWYLTKHSASVWSTEPRPGDGAPAIAAVGAGEPERTKRAPAPVVEEASGPGVIEAYTAVYDRDGAPARGIVLGRQEDGRRFIANTPSDRELLEAFVAEEQVGRGGTLSHRDGANVFVPA